VKKTLFPAAFFLGSLLLICSCSLKLIDAPAGGGGIETVGVAGAARYPGTGKPAALAQVRIRSALFLADVPGIAPGMAGTVLRDAVTDEDGRFSVDSIDTGTYTIEINDGEHNAALIRRTFSRAGSKVDLGVAFLEATGTITGSAGVSVTGNDRIARVFGLQRTAVVDPAGGYELSDIPQGVFRLQIAGANDPALPETVDSVVVGAGTSVAAPPVGWQFSRKLFVNTTASGANVNGTVTGFPVLVRLSGGTFDFNEAQSGGNDVRFAKTDGTLLPFSIGRWERIAGTAEIWVKMDTIYGNDSAHCLVMLWGNSAAVSASSNTAVFGADNGFAGVWHLDADCRDVSGNGHNGTNYGAVDVPGIIGSAKQFNGEDSIKITGLLGTPANVTLSAWIKTDSTISSGQDIVTIGDAAFIRADETVSGYGTGGYAHRYTRNGDTSFTKVTSGLNIAKTGWRFVAFSFDNLTQTHILYIDGLPVRVDNSAYAVDYSGVGNNTFIGMHGNGKKSYAMRGMVDEVRVCKTARSADWIRLCYMNQRIDDKLIVAR
jgi:hypothetical protein